MMTEGKLTDSAKRIAREFQVWYDARCAEDWEDMGEDTLFTLVQMMKAANELSKACGNLLFDAADQYREDAGR